MLTKPRPCAKHAQQFAYHLADSIIRHNLLLSCQQLDVSDCSKLHAGQLWALWNVRHTKKLMSVILPWCAIGHTPTEELCFLLLFSAEAQQYHQNAHCTLIITTRRLFSSFMTHKQTPGVPTKFLKCSSSFYFSPSVAFQNLQHGCLTGRGGAGGDLFTFDHLHALLFIYYQPDSEDIRCHHVFNVSDGCTHPSAAVRQQYRQKQELHIGNIIPFSGIDRITADFQPCPVLWRPTVA